MPHAIHARSIGLLTMVFVGAMTAATLFGASGADAQSPLMFITPFPGIGATPGFGFAGSGGDTGDTVAITDDGPEGNNVPVCTSPVNADGNPPWTCSPSSPAQEGVGEHMYTATETDADGNTVDTVTETVWVTPTPMTITDEEPFQGPTAGGTEVTLTGTNIQQGSTVSIDGGPPITPDSISADGTMLTFTTPAHVAESDVNNVRVLSPTNPNDDPPSNGDYFPFEFDFIPPDPPAFTAPARGTTITDRTPTISGTGSPGDTVTVTEGGATVCSATVDAGGAWSCTPSTPLPTGPNRLLATESDGTDSSTAAADAFVVAAPPTSPAPTRTTTAPPTTPAPTQTTTTTAPAPTGPPDTSPPDTSPPDTSPPNTSSPDRTSTPDPGPTRTSSAASQPPVPPTPPPGDGGGLADTGVSAGQLLGLAVLLALGGAVLLIFTPALTAGRGRHRR